MKLLKNEKINQKLTEIQKDFMKLIILKNKMVVLIYDLIYNLNDL